MDPILYNATIGGRTDFNKQAIIANNLANVNTPGFKADLYQAQTMYTNKGHNSNGTTYNVQAANGVDLTPGELITTGRDLDIAIDGNAWLAFKDTQGRQVFSKSGSLRLDVNGRLTNAAGMAVLGDGGPISIPPAKSIEIGSDGTISIVPFDGDAKSLAVLDRIKLVKLDKNNVVKNDEGMIQLKEGVAAPADSTAKIINGALEGSNVKAVEQMVQMIGAGREFDAQMKILTTIDDNSQKLAQLLHE